MLVCVLCNVLPDDGLQKMPKHVAVMYITNIFLCSVAERRKYILKCNSLTGWVLPIVSVHILQNEMGCACWTYGDRNVLICMVSMGRPDRRRQLGRLWLRREDHCRVTLKEIIWEAVDWIDLAQVRDNWQTVVNVVINFGFHKTRGFPLQSRDCWIMKDSACCNYLRRTSGAEPGLLPTKWRFFLTTPHTEVKCLTFPLTFPFIDSSAAIYYPSLFVSSRYKGLSVRVWKEELVILKPGHCNVNF